MIAEPRVPVIHRMIDLISNGLLLDDIGSDKEAYRTVNSYLPHGSAKELHEDNTSSEILISGPAGTGKSRACLEKLHKCAMLYPKMRGLIVRKTRSSLNESALVTYEQHVLGIEHPILAHTLQRRNRQSYIYPNGSEIVVGGMDYASRIMSTEFDLIFVQEATELTENDWESLLTRLRNDKIPFQQLIADCNPDRPDHWLKKRCDSEQTRMIFSQHEDNPTLYDSAIKQWTERGRKYIENILEKLTGVRFSRLREGKWVQAEGAVYDKWNEAIHLKDHFDIPADWRRIRVIDFGFVNPFVCSWYAMDNDGRMYRYREIYMTQGLVEDFAKQIKALSEGEKIEATVADHDAEDRATLDRHGVSTIPAKKDLSPGIQAVQARLAKASDGKPRLFFLRDSLVEVDERLVEEKKPTCTEQEIAGYVWTKGADGKPVKEVPVKVDDHGCDVLRYAVMYLDRRGRLSLL